MTKFVKGAPSPNPKGRPKGSKSAPNLLRDGLVGIRDLKEVVAVIVKKARDGDLQAAAILLDRTVPRLKPAADVIDESALAEATTAAKVRGAKSEGSGLISLEELIAASVSTLPKPSAPATKPAVQAPSAEAPSAEAPSAEAPSAEAPSAEAPPMTAAPPPPAPAPVRPISIPMPPADDDIYNPM